MQNHILYKMVNRGGVMKKIEVIIKPSKLDEVKGALNDIKVKGENRK